MANTVSILSYDNTFGEWFVNTNSLAVENNIFACNNYIKGAGTLFLNDPTLGLQVASKAIINGKLQVVGIGSSTELQNDVSIGGALTIGSNTNQSLTTAAQANIGGPLFALGSGNGLTVANNTVVGGTTFIGGVLTANSASILNGALTVTGLTNISNTVFITGATTISNNITITNNGYIANNLYVTNNIDAGSLSIGTLNALNAIIKYQTISNTIQAFISVNTSNVFADAVYSKNIQVSGITLSNNFQANNLVQTQNLNVIGTEWVDTIVANTLITVPTLTVTNTSTSVNSYSTFARSITIQANNLVQTQSLNVIGSQWVDTINANTVITVPTLTVTNTSTTPNSYSTFARSNTIQANNLVQTQNLNVIGTGWANIFNANTLITVPTLTVTSTSTSVNSYSTFTRSNTIQANNLVQTQNLNVIGTQWVDTIVANTLITVPTLSATNSYSTFVRSNTIQANNLVQTQNLNVIGTGFADIFNANTNIITPRATITGVLDANTATCYVNNLNTLGSLSIGGNFVLTGTTAYNTNEFVLSAGTPNQISYLGVYRNTESGNSYIRWNELNKVWESKDVNTGTYYRLLTDQYLSTSLTSGSTTTVATSSTVSTLNNNQLNANTQMKAYVDGNINYLQGIENTQNTNITNTQTWLNANNLYNTGVSVSQNNRITTVEANTVYLFGALNQTNTNFALANTQMKSYVDGQLSANLAYSNGVDTAQNTRISTVEANTVYLFGALNQTNTNVLSANTQLKSYIDGQLSANLTYSNGVGTAQNTRITTVEANTVYLFGALNASNANTASANTQMKSYVDGQMSANLSYSSGVDATQNTNITNTQNWLNANIAYISGVDTAQNTNITTARNLAQGAYDKANTDVTSISVSSGAYGAAATVPILGLEANGRISSITTTSIVIPGSSVSGTVPQANVAQYVGVTSVATGTYYPKLGLGTSGDSKDYGSSLLSFNAATGSLTASAINGVTITAASPSSTFTLAAGKILTASNSLTLNGTDGKTLTINNSLSLNGTDSSVLTFPAGTVNIGYLEVPQNAQSASYVLTAADSGKHIYHAAGAGAATYTIPANVTVPLPIGTAFTFINMSSVSTVLIGINTDTLYFAGPGTTGTRTLAQYGTATAIKITSGTWLISGTGIS